MERYHSIVQPAKEIVRSIGERALNWIIPREALDMFVQNESASRTSQLFAHKESQEE